MKLEGESEVVPVSKHQVIKEYRERGGKNPRISYLDVRCR